MRGKNDRKHANPAHISLGLDPETEAVWESLTPEQRLEKIQFPQWAFLTYSTTQHPPRRGYLIPIQGWDRASRSDVVFPSVSLCIVKTAEEEKDEVRFVPSVTVSIDGNYRGTFVDSEVTFHASAIRESDVIKCDVMVASNKPWVQTVWKCTWEKLPLIPRSHDKVWSRTPLTPPMPGPVLCDEYFRAPREREAKLSPAHKKYLVMMLMHDFWNRHPDKQDSHNADLFALKVASNKSDRRSFTNDTGRASIYSIKSTVVDHTTWLWHPGRAPKGLDGWGYNAINSKNLPRHWFK